MTEIDKLNAELLQLAAAAQSLEDPFAMGQLRIAIGQLANAIESGANGVNAAVVNDIEFALNDVTASIADIPPDDVATIETILTAMREDVAAMKAAVALPADVVNGVRALQTKLKTRRTAIERQTYVENADANALPHAPEELRADALPLRDSLAGAGFATPALDALIDDPSSLRFHSINEIVDELDVIISA
jgi:putative N-acetylmannosamine-6-phosphate epimerase